MRKVAGPEKAQKCQVSITRFSCQGWTACEKCRFLRVGPKLDFWKSENLQNLKLTFKKNFFPESQNPDFSRMSQTSKNGRFSEIWPIRGKSENLKIQIDFSPKKILPRVPKSGFLSVDPDFEKNGRFLGLADPRKIRNLRFEKFLKSKFGFFDFRIFQISDFPRMDETSKNDPFSHTLLTGHEIRVIETWQFFTLLQTLCMTEFKQVLTRI